jgi:GAF domain-containing protein
MTTSSRQEDKLALASTAKVASETFGDPVEALEAILGAAQRITGFQTVLLSEISTEKGELCIHAVENSDPALTVPLGLKIPLASSPCQHVATSVEPFVSTNMQANAELSVLPAAKDMGASAYIGVPVVLGDGSFFGTLVGLDTEPHEESQEHIQWMQVLARIAAQQIERQRAAEVA